MKLNAEMAAKLAERLIQLHYMPSDRNIRYLIAMLAITFREMRQFECDVYVLDREAGMHLTMVPTREGMTFEGDEHSVAKAQARYQAGLDQGLYEWKVEDDFPGHPEPDEAAQEAEYGNARIGA